MAKEEAKGKKLSYEELEKYAQDVTAKANYFQSQAQAMMKKIEELSNFAMFKRLDYLFDVVKNDDKFPKEFVDASREEIIVTMTPPVDEPKDQKEEEK